MKPRHFLARIAALVTAAAAIGMLLGATRADAADHQPDGSARSDMESATAEAIEIGSEIDGWTNRDLDIGTFDLSEATAEELGSRMDGWANGDFDLSSADVWEAMALGIGDILDGWANRDIDIGTF
jgi:hypothetical protein